MCLITLNWQPGQSVPLRMAANRDEFYARPTLGLHHWPGQGILAGRDLQAGGTWLGLGLGTDGGAGAGHIRLAALTNYRDIAHHRPDAASRGHVTASFLNSSVGARDYLESLVTTASCYNPFNLILFDGQALLGFESRHAHLFALPVGITSVSNADFNTPWPKLKRLHSSFEQTLAASHDETLLQRRLLKLLSDDQMASDSELPQTGMALDKERVLSAAFIRTPDYGTRASSVIRIGSHHAQFTERCFDANGLRGETTQTLSWRNLDRR